MKRFDIRQSLIVKLAVLALGTLCSLQTTANAQEMYGYIVMFPSVGLAQGQQLRFTLFKEDGTPVRAQLRVHHAGSIQVGLGDGSVRFVQPGIAQSFNLDRDDISLPGETGTGRLQLRASFLIGTTERALGKLAVSMETIRDGTSNTVFFSEVGPFAPDSGGGGDLLLGGDARDVLMGVVPGETLRVTLINPPSLDSSRQQPIANGHIKIFDSSGIPIAQSDEAIIPSGTFHSFDFNPNTFASRGERGTGRHQVRIKPFYEFRTERLSPLLASFEIVDNQTGQTRVLVGHECLVFYLGGIPVD